MYYDKSKFTDSDVKSLDTMLAKDKVAFNITEGWYMSSFFLANDCVYFGKDGKDNAAGIDISDDKGIKCNESNGIYGQQSEFCKRCRRCRNRRSA